MPCGTRANGQSNYRLDVTALGGKGACTKITSAVNVPQSDLESGLAGLADESFDCVILSQTGQAMRHTETIVQEMLRVGHEVIVTLPEFGGWKHR